MPTTTIKVDTVLRDRLKFEAHRKGITIGSLLDELLAISERDARFAEIKAAVARTERAAMREYEAEVAEWDSATLADGTKIGE